MNLLAPKDQKVVKIRGKADTRFYFIFARIFGRDRSIHCPEKLIIEERLCDEKKSLHLFRSNQLEKDFPTGIHLFQVNSGNIRTMCDVVLVFVLLILNRFHIALVFPLLTLKIKIAPPFP